MMIKDKLKHSGGQNIQNFKFLFAILLLFTACKQDKKSNQIPVTFIDTLNFFKREIRTDSDGQPDLFYTLAKSKQNQLGLDSLENGFAGLQIRVWYDFSRSTERRLVVIKNMDTTWTATVYNMNVNWDGESETIIKKDVKQVTPKSGWGNFAKQLLDLKIVSLPDMKNIPGFDVGKDGKMFNVEIASKNQYRFYGYWEPDQYSNKYWQAKNMAEILELFKVELGVGN